MHVFFFSSIDFNKLFYMIQTFDLFGYSPFLFFTHFATFYSNFSNTMVLEHVTNDGQLQGILNAADYKLVVVDFYADWLDFYNSIKCCLGVLHAVQLLQFSNNYRITT